MRTKCGFRRTHTLRLRVARAGPVMFIFRSSKAAIDHEADLLIFGRRSLRTAETGNATLHLSVHRVDFPALQAIVDIRCRHSRSHTGKCGSLLLLSFC